MLADEINRATPKTQSALLEAMAEHAVTIAGQRHALEEPFFVLATENPIEMEGTYPLPEAQLDRFLLKVVVPNPTEDELCAVLVRTTGRAPEPPPRVIDRDGVLALRGMCRDVAVAEPVLRYAARLVRASDPSAAEAPETVKRARPLRRRRPRGAVAGAGGQGGGALRGAGERVVRRREARGQAGAAPPADPFVRGRGRGDDHGRGRRRAARHRRDAPGERRGGTAAGCRVS